ncbi:MAG: outer membrane beta-barrel protein [Candidatus Omnitrophota bacterium]
MSTNKINNRLVFLGVACTLVLMLCFAASSAHAVLSSQQDASTLESDVLTPQSDAPQVGAVAVPPRPKTPRQPLEPAELMTVATPKVVQTVPSYQDGSPYSLAPAYFWQQHTEADIAAQYGKGEGNIHWGKLELHPMAGFEQKYDTNIALAPRGQANPEWISDYIAGLAGRMPLVSSRGDDFLAEAAYRADFLDYMRHDKLSRVDHTVHGSVRGNFTNGIGVKVTEDFIKTQDQANNELTALQKRWWNKLDGRINYTREKITVEAAYTVIMNRYLQAHNISYNDHMMTGAIFYNISAKTRVFNEFNLGRIQYRKSPTNSNSYYYQDRIGVEGKIAPKTTGTVKLGFRYQDYERKTQKDYAQITAFGNIKYDLSERTNFNLYGETRPEESSYATNSYYISNIVGLRGEHLLTKRLAVAGGVFWAYDQYRALSVEGDQAAKRHDTLWGADATLKYELRRWWLLDAGYRFKQRDSRFNNFDYNDQQVTMRSSFLF